MTQHDCIPSDLQPTLPSAPREFDLPPRWDGETIRWEPWQPEPAILCLPPQKCEVCQVAAGDDTAQGRCLLDTESRLKRSNTDSTYLKLIAKRCRHCGHDRVLDVATGQWWDLDDTDYTRFGSIA